MAILSELIEMSQLHDDLASKYGSFIFDKENNESLDGWNSLFKRIRFGKDWKTNSDYLDEENCFGGIPKVYFETAKKILNDGPPPFITFKK